MSPLKRSRKSQNISIRALARRVGTTAGNLSRIENHKQQASPALAAKLARALGYALTEIQILYPERFTADNSEVQP